MFVQITDLAYNKKYIVNTEQIVSIQEINGKYAISFPGKLTYDLQMSRADYERLLAGIGAENIFETIDI